MDPHAFNTREEELVRASCSDLYGVGGEPPGKPPARLLLEARSRDDR
jgi:hypothetical protein